MCKARNMLTIKNLSIAAGQKSLLQKVSLALGAGESLALMGASGSGKSLLALACMDLLPLNVQKIQGDIAFEGARPAIVMQNPADCFDPLFRVRSVFEETFSAKVQGVVVKDSEEFITSLLLKVGFVHPQEILNKYPFELSGGMLHRLMLALALGGVILGKVHCVIADEPLSGLDTPSKVYLLELLKKLQQEYGFALLYIDHDLNAAQTVAKRLAVMHCGSIVEEGDFAHLLQAPKHEATQSLVQAFKRANTLRVKESFTPSESAEPILKVCNISKLYYGVSAVDGVSFDLYKGQSLGLVGANGAGKSTLIRLLLGLEDADAGHTSCFGHRVQKTYAKTEWRKDLQVMFQHARLAVNPRMQAQDILLEPLLAHFSSKLNKQEKERKVHELLELVELPSLFAKKYPMNMSGGQLQRLCLARALALEPKIVILDEPLADLDAAVAELLQEKLQELQNKLGLSYIYISHDIGSILRMCDTVCVLERGQLVDTFKSCAFAQSERHKAFQDLYEASFIRKTHAD